MKVERYPNLQAEVGSSNPSQETTSFSIQIFVDWTLTQSVQNTNRPLESEVSLVMDTSGNPPLLLSNLQQLFHKKEPQVLPSE